MQWYPFLLEWNPGDPKIFWDVVHGNRKNSRGDNWDVVALALTVGKEIQILATLRITSRPRNTNQLLWRNTDVALQEIREIQMQPVKLSTNTMRDLDISDLDHNRFALGFKLTNYDAHVHSDVTARVSILAIHKKNYALYKYTWPRSWTQLHNYNGLRQRHKHYARTQVFVIAEENSGPLYHWSIDITCTGPGQLRNRFQFWGSSWSDILN